MLVFSSFWKWLFSIYTDWCTYRHQINICIAYLCISCWLKYSYANDIFLASWCLSRKASDFVNEWLSGTSTCWSLFCVTYESICIGFCCTSVCGFRICWRDCGKMSLVLIVVILFYLCSWYVLLGFVCSHVGVRRSIIVCFLLYFCEVFFLFVFFVLYTWLFYFSS